MFQKSKSASTNPSLSLHSSAQEAKVSLLWLNIQSPIYRPLPITVLREVAAYLSALPIFVLLTNETISYLDLRKGVKSPDIGLIAADLRACCNPSYAVIDDSHILCCGGIGKK